ncbi:hypothetical protein DFA_08537 [Cavenderia fasciculata]|uniref:Uncharacterized protein n=1 Tax=Cavenderia fasciculata TaxID=261658 RepID=F4Q2X7_CACFS|nr:uncharacterized protein DFA_08537 [Cavenderia fasciculata]EGG17541.1 hypothetical protein DFA_08537 [Cavenderia fasciculata]|eukprot:XP_004356025.1 hypothetical protein DFA_08537 [Cavenderia fasciculata]
MFDLFKKNNNKQKSYSSKWNESEILNGKSEHRFKAKYENQSVLIILNELGLEVVNDSTNKSFMEFQLGDIKTFGCRTTNSIWEIEVREEANRFNIYKFHNVNGRHLNCITSNFLQNLKFERMIEVEAVKTHKLSPSI